MLRLGTKRQVDFIHTLTQSAVRDHVIPRRILAPLVDNHVLPAPVRRAFKRLEEEEVAAAAEQSNVAAAAATTSTTSSPSWSRRPADDLFSIVLKSNETNTIKSSTISNEEYLRALLPFPALPLFCFCHSDTVFSEVTQKHFRAVLEHAPDSALGIAARRYLDYFARMDAGIHAAATEHDRQWRIADGKRRQVAMQEEASNKVQSQKIVSSGSRDDVSSAGNDNGETKHGNKVEKKVEQQQEASTAAENGTAAKKKGLTKSQRKKRRHLLNHIYCTADPWMPFVEPFPTAIHTVSDLAARFSARSGSLSRKKKSSAQLEGSSARVSVSQRRRLKKLLAMKTAENAANASNNNNNNGNVSSAVRRLREQIALYPPSPGVRFRLSRLAGPKGARKVSSIWASASYALTPVRTSAAVALHNSFWPSSSSSSSSSASVAPPPPPPPPPHEPELWVSMHGLSVPLATSFQHFFVSADMGREFVVKQHKEKGFVGVLAAALQRNPPLLKSVTNVRSDSTVDGAESRWKKRARKQPQQGKEQQREDEQEGEQRQQEEEEYQQPTAKKLRVQDELAGSFETDGYSEIPAFWWWYVWVNRNSAALLALADPRLVLRKVRQVNPAVCGALYEAQEAIGLKNSEATAAAAAEVAGTDATREEEENNSNNNNTDNSKQHSATSSSAGTGTLDPRGNFYGTDHRFALYLLEQRMVQELSSSPSSSDSSSSAAVDSSSSSSTRMDDYVRRFRHFQSECKLRGWARRAVRSTYLAEIRRWRYWRLLSSHVPWFAMNVAFASALKEASSPLSASSVSSFTRGRAVPNDEFDQHSLSEYSKLSALSFTSLRCHNANKNSSQAAVAAVAPPSPPVSAVVSPSAALEALLSPRYGFASFKVSPAEKSSLVYYSEKPKRGFHLSCPAVDTHNFWTSFSIAPSTARDAWHQLPLRHRLVLDVRRPPLMRGETQDDPLYQYLLYRLNNEVDQAAAASDERGYYSDFEEGVGDNELVVVETTRNKVVGVNNNTAAQQQQLEELQLHSDLLFHLVRRFRNEWDSLHPLEQARFYNEERIRSVFPDFSGFDRRDVDVFKQDLGAFDEDDLDAFLTGSGSGVSSDHHGINNAHESGLRRQIRDNNTFLQLGTAASGDVDGFVGGAYAQWMMMGADFAAVARSRQRKLLNGGDGDDDDLDYDDDQFQTNDDHDHRSEPRHRHRGRRRQRKRRRSKKTRRRQKAALVSTASES